MSKFIPVCEPTLGDKELTYSIKALKSGWISSSGSYITEFENRFSNYCGTKYGIALNSGTAALHCALLALGIKEGDEVIIPNFTMVAVLFSVLYVKAKPVFVDIRNDTWNIDEEKIEEKISKKTKAIIAVHTYGHPANMTEINKIAKKHKIYVIEDAAEAHGASHYDNKTGGMSDISCFSFYANKIITTGEGGMALTNNKDFANKIKFYKNLCFKVDGPRDYLHSDIGYNFRMTNVQAAIGCGQLDNIENLVERRRRNAKLYNKFLKDIPGIQTPVELENNKNVYWMYGIVINPRKLGKTREEFIKLLSDKKIDSRIFFKALSKQPLLKKSNIKTDKSSYPVTTNLAKNGLYLPSSSHLKESQIKFICETIKEISKK